MKASYCLPSGNYNIIERKVGGDTMAQKRIKMVRTDNLNHKVRLFYDDDSQGELDMTKAKTSMLEATVLVGLTLKQAKMRLGIKS